MNNDMCLQDTVYHLAHDYPGGVPALAARMGKNPTVLMHKLNPNNSTHYLNAHEMDAIDDLTGTDRIAEYFARKHSFYLVKMQHLEGMDESALMDAFLDVSREWGTYCMEFQKAWADGKITKQEFRLLREQGIEVRQRMLALCDRIFQMVED